MDSGKKVNTPSFGAVSYSKIPARVSAKDLGEHIVRNLGLPKNKKLACGIGNLVENIEAIGHQIDKPIGIETFNYSSVEVVDLSARKVKDTAANVVKTAQEIAYGKPGKKHDFFGAVVQFFRALGDWMVSGFKNTASFSKVKETYNKPQVEFSKAMQDQVGKLGHTMTDLITNCDFADRAPDERKKQLFIAFTQIREGFAEKPIANSSEEALWGVTIAAMGGKLGL